MSHGRVRIGPTKTDSPESAEPLVATAIESL
jgi:hypothetical protein